jgi:peptidoglycan hydrolase-like protein with peptidoglycan-binding domain
MIQAQQELRSVTERGGQEAPALKAMRRLNGGSLAKLLGPDPVTVNDAIDVSRARVPVPDVYPADHTVLPANPQAIRKFQHFHGLVPDGIIGPKTSRAMRETNTSLGSSTYPH